MNTTKTNQTKPTAYKNNQKEEGVKNLQSGMTQQKKETVFTFGKQNYILLVIGVILLALGYILLSGGGSDDPNVFNEEMFNSRRLVVAPLLIVFGLVVEICAIMFRPKEKKEENNE